MEPLPRTLRHVRPVSRPASPTSPPGPASASPRSRASSTAACGVRPAPASASSRRSRRSTTARARSRATSPSGGRWWWRRSARCSRTRRRWSGSRHRRRPERLALRPDGLRHRVGGPAAPRVRALRPRRPGGRPPRRLDAPARGRGRPPPRRRNPLRPDRRGHPAFPSIAVDDVAGGELATRHLVELGHRRIALIGDPPPEFRFDWSRDRTRGYERALAAAGIEARADYVREGTRLPHVARAVAAELLSLPERPTAVFAASDTQAIGVLEAARALGIDVPGELSVVGFDDIEVAAYVGLTTVRQPLFESGRRGAKLLLELLAGRRPASRSASCCRSSSSSAARPGRLRRRALSRPFAKTVSRFLQESGRNRQPQTGAGALSFRTVRDRLAALPWRAG